MLISTVYHWSPKRHRRRILREGLRVMEPARLGPGIDNYPYEVSYPWLCCGADPLSAWALVLDTDDEEEGFDLWLIHLRPRDQLRIRPDEEEVRVLHSLPADRVHWVGERLEFAHESLEPVPLKKVSEDESTDRP